MAEVSLTMHLVDHIIPVNLSRHQYADPDLVRKRPAQDRPLFDINVNDNLVIGTDPCCLATDIGCVLYFNQ